MSSIFVLEKKNSVTKGVSWELEMFAKCKGGMFLPSPYQKVGGLFIARNHWKTTNYYLLQIYPQRDLHDPVGPNIG
jgi:hypothetical protein